MRNALKQTAFETIAECAKASGVRNQGFAREFGGFAEADDSSDVFSAGAKAALMMAAEEKLAQTCSAADVECANALGCVELVAREGE